jgi:hypothetical protein
MSSLYSLIHAIRNLGAILLLCIGMLWAGGAQAQVTVTVGGTTYNIVTVGPDYAANAADIQETPWWNQPASDPNVGASAFAEAYFAQTGVAGTPLFAYALDGPNKLLAATPKTTAGSANPNVNRNIDYAILGAAVIPEISGATLLMAGFVLFALWVVVMGRRARVS